MTEEQFNQNFTLMQQNLSKITQTALTLLNDHIADPCFTDKDKKSFITSYAISMGVTLFYNALFVAMNKDLMSNQDGTVALTKLISELSTQGCDLFLEFDINKKSHEKLNDFLSH